MRDRYRSARILKVDARASVSSSIIEAERELQRVRRVKCVLLDQHLSMALEQGKADPTNAAVLSGLDAMARLDRYEVRAMQPRPRCNGVFGIERCVSQPKEDKSIPCAKCV